MIKILFIYIKYQSSLLIKGLHICPIYCPFCGGAMHITESYHSLSGTVNRHHCFKCEKIF